jgi:hypothetical protein
MRQKNWRVVFVGCGLLVLAIAFFFGMVGTAAKSADPAALMRIVGQVSGVVGSIGVLMIAVGLIGVRRRT